MGGKEGGSREREGGRDGLRAFSYQLSLQLKTNSLQLHLKMGQWWSDTNGTVVRL